MKRIAYSTSILPHCIYCIYSLPEGYIRCVISTFSESCQIIVFFRIRINVTADLLCWKYIRLVLLDIFTHMGFRFLGATLFIKFIKI